MRANGKKRDDWSKDWREMSMKVARNMQYKMSQENNGQRKISEKARIKWYKIQLKSDEIRIPNIENFSTEFSLRERKCKMVKLYFG